MPRWSKETSSQFTEVDNNGLFYIAMEGPKDKKTAVTNDFFKKRKIKGLQAIILCSALPPTDTLTGEK